MHTLHLIGWLGSKVAFLDVPLDEARRRYCTSEGVADDKDLHVLSFEFEDMFECYDAWSADAE